MTTADRLNAMPLGEAMFTQRAIRRFRKDPIPPDVVQDIMADQCGAILSDFFASKRKGIGTAE